MEFVHLFRVVSAYVVKMEIVSYWCEEFNKY
jgi:hypothetical protein